MLRRYRAPGVTLAELLVVIAIIGTLLALLLPAVQKVRATAHKASCANNLHQIALALHQYYDTTGVFPPGASSPQSRDPYPWMSWRTRLLPYLEQEALWLETQRAYAAEDVFFVNPPHVGLATVMPPFACPSDTRASDVQTTHGNMHVALSSYTGVSGTVVNRNDGVLFLDSRIRLKDITDGTSNTLMVGERPASTDCWFGWWYAGEGQHKTGSGDAFLGVREINLGGDYISDCPPGPYHFQAGNLHQQCDLFHFWSLHSGGAHFAFADGSVHFLSYAADDILPALATRCGWEAVTLP